MGMGHQLEMEGLADCAGDIDNDPYEGYNRSASRNVRSQRYGSDPAGYAGAPTGRIRIPYLPPLHNFPPRPYQGPTPHRIVVDSLSTWHEEYRKRQQRKREAERLYFNSSAQDLVGKEFTAKINTSGYVSGFELKPL